MGRLIVDHSSRPGKSARVERYAALERGPDGRLTPVFAALYRRMRKARPGQGRFPRYLAIARKG